ncbi:hypothetical protein EON63_24190 [archaeon]|nr:MAG: hypothetical protein EON63_24190 [archaeon]
MSANANTYIHIHISAGILCSNLFAYPLISSSSANSDGAKHSDIHTAATDSDGVWHTMSSLLSTHNWRYLFLVTPILCTLQLVLSRYLLESPRYLLNMDPASRLARINIKKLRAFR